ncbi:hypothetical protein BC629DRAFT_805824 [Irpex lacteus]|nr:hypothetical protein BC629DRAFT_805824 [Irpex lacteus]
MPPPRKFRISKESQSAGREGLAGSNDETNSNLKTGDGSSDVDSETSDETRSLKTTRKVTGRKRGKRNQGRLHRMLDMPLDVIHEICLYLLPKDLLNMARTSKELRAYFMSRNTQRLWQAARLNIPDLPPCPDDLSEPAFANLVFDPHCHRCLGKNCHQVYWAPRTRLCKGCFDIVAIKETDLEEHGFDLDDLVDFTDEDEQSCELCDIVPIMRQEDSPNVWGYYGPLLFEFIETWKQTPRYSREELLDKLYRKTWQLWEDGFELARWYKARQKSRTDEREGLREARRKAIIAKLREEGWHEDFEYMKSRDRFDIYEFDSLPEVRKPQALTDRIWRNIKPGIIELMENMRAQRLAGLRKQTLTDRLSALEKFTKELASRSPGLDLTPREVAILCPEIPSLLDPDVNAEFNPDDLGEPIQRYLNKRIEDARDSLRKMIIYECELDPSCDPFSLAVGAWFFCRWCTTARHLDHAIRHHCINLSEPKRPPDMCGVYYRLVCKMFVNQGTWCVDRYRDGVSTVAEIIQACGLDPKTATVDDMDKVDVRFQCKCSHHRQQQGYMPIMNWRTSAVKSLYTCLPCCTLKKAFKSQVAAVGPLEPIAKEVHLRSWNADPMFACARCSSRTNVDKATVMVHLRENHGINEPSKDDWKDEHMTVPIPGPTYLVLTKFQDKPSKKVGKLLKDGVAAFHNF